MDIFHQEKNGHNPLYKGLLLPIYAKYTPPCSGAAIIGGTGGRVLPTFWLGDAKVNVPPLIAHLVKFLGHIFHLDKLD